MHARSYGVPRRLVLHVWGEFEFRHLQASLHTRGLLLKRGLGRPDYARSREAYERNSQIALRPSLGSTHPTVHAA